MNRGFSVAFLCSLMLCVALAAYSARGADVAPDEILKSKGLTKVGTLYLLDRDANISDAVRAWRAAQAKYNQNMTKRSNLEQQVRTMNTALDKLADQNDFETQKLKRIGVSADASYNKQVDVVNAVRAKMRDGMKALKQRQKTLDSFDDPSEEYSAAIQTFATSMEAVAKNYDSLASDSEVTDALAKLTDGAATPVKLGPSDLFRTELKRVRNLQKQFVSSTINFDIIGGVPHVPILINGDVKAEAIIDSGAGIVLLTAETAKKLDIKPSPRDRTERFITADGSTVEGRVVTLDSVRLGAFTVKDVEASILPDGTKGADNLLGGTFLKSFVYKMDLAGGSIRLTQLVTSDDESAATQPAVAQTVAVKEKNRVDEVVVEALIDGNTELHITKDGIYWKSFDVAKPGRHDGKKESTWVNGKEWKPEWQNPDEDRGTDESDKFPLPIGSTQYKFEVLSISEKRGGSDSDPRDPVTIRVSKGQQILSIPDTQGGARWYKIALTRRR